MNVTDINASEVMKIGRIWRGRSDLRAQAKKEAVKLGLTGEQTKLYVGDYLTEKTPCHGVVLYELLNAAGIKDTITLDLDTVRERLGGGDIQDKLVISSEMLLDAGVFYLGFDIQDSEVVFRISKGTEMKVNNPTTDDLLEELEQCIEDQDRVQGQALIYQLRSRYQGQMDTRHKILEAEEAMYGRLNITAFVAILGIRDAIDMYTEK